MGLSQIYDQHFVEYTYADGMKMSASAASSRTSGKRFAK